VTSAAGYLYVKALPDFVRWERTRTPSALAQLVTAPLQAVRGTIQQAQHLGTYASETYGVLRDNAKSFVDETLGELKKVSLVVIVGVETVIKYNHEGILIAIIFYLQINKSKVLNFFGFGKSDK
jgi:hypothetical protein